MDVGTLCRCKHRFVPEHPAELGLEPGALVTVLEPDRDGWTYCALVSDPDQKGCAPTKFLEPSSGAATSSAAAAPSAGAGRSVTTAKPADTISAAATPPSPVVNKSATGVGNTSGAGIAGNTGGGPYRSQNPQNYSSLAQASVTAANNASLLVRSGSTATPGNPNVPDAAALMEGFHKNELYFQQLLVQRQESTAALDQALREAASEIDLAKEKHSSLTRRLKELDHMVTKERKRWKDRVEEERLLLAQRAGASGATSTTVVTTQHQQQSQQQSRGFQPGNDYGSGAQAQIDLLRRK
jgi:hypothetical protein